MQGSAGKRQGLPEMPVSLMERGAGAKPLGVDSRAKRAMGIGSSDGT